MSNPIDLDLTKMKKINLLVLFLSLILTFCTDRVSSSTDLKGHWKWTSTCGGFVGCTYPSQANTQKLIIQETHIKSFTNDDLIFSKNYSILSLTEGDDSIIYEIKFDDNEIWMCEISNNILTIHYNSIITSTFERTSGILLDWN